MIQRIQTIFLALAAVGGFALLALPFASSESAAPGIFSDQAYTIHDHTALLVLFLLGAILSLAAIFLFRNRQTQMKLVRLGFVVFVVALTLSIILFFNEAKTNEAMAAVEVNDEMGLYLPIVALLLMGLALRAIRKDEQTVRSIDRLR